MRFDAGLQISDQLQTGMNEQDGNRIFIIIKGRFIACAPVSCSFFLGGFLVSFLDSFPDQVLNMLFFVVRSKGASADIFVPIRMQVAKSSAVSSSQRRSVHSAHPAFSALAATPDIPYP